MLLVDDLLVDEHLDHISLVHINGNDSDDFDTKLLVKWVTDSLNKIIDTLLDEYRVIFHGSLTTSIHIIELPDCFLSPDDLSAKK